MTVEMTGAEFLMAVAGAAPSLSMAMNSQLRPMALPRSPPATKPSRAGQG